jgi:NTP pyrophosphatase (non-canonical NTP hydrolase)
MINRKNIWSAIELELRKAKKQHPNWPDHVAAQAGIVVEEVGELMKACLKFKYENNTDVIKDIELREQMKQEAIQTAAMAIRFLENLK